MWIVQKQTHDDIIVLKTIKSKVIILTFECLQIVYGSADIDMQNTDKSWIARLQLIRPLSLWKRVAKGFTATTTIINPSEIEK